MGTSDPALLMALMLARELSPEAIKPVGAPDEALEKDQGPPDPAGLLHTQLGGPSGT